MVSVWDYIELFFSWLFANAKGRDDKLFIRGPAFADLPDPTLTVESPDCGPSHSHMKPEHTPLGPTGANRFPTLTWTLSRPPPSTSSPSSPSAPPPSRSEGRDVVQEYLVVAEDPDAPMPTPITHGIYYGIPATRTSITPEDIELLADSGAGAGTGTTPKVTNDKNNSNLKGGFKRGANWNKTVYSGPRPLLNHGPHRYWYQVIALKEPLDRTVLSSPLATKKEIAQAIQGKVVGWGAWIGVYERKWE
ncbi:PEBP-like protein [Xylona heveae TC161]|uniref:PEBP-like protein n=1 Tax=Xylona heveae (strain CBS 132557 / TC161) TaxID=1328760 RepID=A0A165JYP2_XYLHT|nr:PEBP-like protein [Xylona heveae TC161]KZF26793.1 PEBP-like protein [Xylona heveae TC161]